MTRVSHVVAIVVSVLCVPGIAVQTSWSGGSARTFALQPVSLEGSVAVDVALGVSALKLRAVP